MDGASLRQALSVLPAPATGQPPTVAVYSRSARPPSSVWPFRPLPADAAQAAHELFAALRELDATGAALIWIETPPADPAWDGVRDRLQRAAAD